MNLTDQLTDRGVVVGLDLRYPEDLVPVLDLAGHLVEFLGHLLGGALDAADVGLVLFVFIVVAEKAREISGRAASIHGLGRRGRGDARAFCGLS